MRRAFIVFLLTTGLCSSLTQNAFAVAPTITSRSGDQSVQAGGTATFSATANNYDVVSWKVSTDGGSTFTDLVQDSTFSGVFTPTLRISRVPLSYNGYKFRVVFRNLSSPVTECQTTMLLTVTTASASFSQNVNSSSLAVDQFLLSAYAAHQAGTGSLLTLQSAYLAYLNIQDALNSDAVGDVASRENSAYQAAVFAYYGKNYSLIDVNASGSADAQNANLYANYTLYLAYQVFLGN